MAFVFGVVIAVVWTALAARLIGKRRACRFLRARPWPDSSRAPSVDVVVPAFNEERDIAATVADLLAQSYPAFTLTVVDDQSTDGTGKILRELAAKRSAMRWIEGVDRPAGWVGKTWALHQGVVGTDAEWLLFVDADMRLHPDALASAMLEAESTGSDFVSLLPRVECRTLWQASVALTLAQILAQLYPLDAVNDPKRPEALAAGGFILVRRSTYLAAGGHEAVRREIVDDILLARRVKAVDGRLTVRPAPDLASTHMYGSLADIWRGLRKNAYAGMDNLLHKFIFGSIIALTVAWGPWVCAAAALATASFPLGLVAAWGILAQGAASLPNAVFLRLDPLWTLSMPIGMTVYVGIAASAVLDYHSGRILWKGRNLRLKTTDGEPTDSKTAEARNRI